MKEALFKREAYLKKIRGFYHEADLIKVLTGVRRCGKSSLMNLVSSEIKEQGVEDEAIIYINLEETSKRKIKTADALEEFILQQSSFKGLKYLFVDEIQNVEGFEEVVNGFRASDEYSIFITGSNSYLLSGELMTKLTGRYIAFECFPMTFDEWIDMHEFYDIALTSDKNDQLSKYILEGGFPRTVFFENVADKRAYVNATVNEIIEKDVYRRIKVKNRDSFRKLMMFVVNNYASPMSIRSIAEAMNENGIAISTATVARYVEALESAKIIYSCPAFDMKSKKSIGGQIKHYLSDLSFYFALNTNNALNFGPSLENIAYIYARHLDYSVSVGRCGNLECDFILRNASNEYAYVQVSYMMLGNEETEEREYRPLEKIKDNYPKYILTMDPLQQQRNGIQHHNIADFMKKGERF